MKCAFCSKCATFEQAIADGWEPYWNVGSKKCHKPCCPECANKYLDFTNEKDGGNMKAELSSEGVWEVWENTGDDIWEVLASGNTEQEALDNAVDELTGRELRNAWTRE